MKKNISKIAFAMMTGVIGTGLVGLTAVISGINYGNYSKSARDAERIGDIENLNSAVIQYYTAESKYPLPSEFSSNGRISDYLWGTLPTDPTTGEFYISKNGETTILDYAYAVGNSENGVELQSFELSTGFESKKNITNKAEKDNGDDDLRYEKGVNIYNTDCKSKLSNGKENPFKCKQKGKETAIGMIIDQDFLDGKYDSKIKSLESSFTQKNTKNTSSSSNNSKNTSTSTKSNNSTTKTKDSESCFTFDKNTKTITDYDINCGSDVKIPSTIGGVIVENIGDSAFAGGLSKKLDGEIVLTKVTIPNTVKNIGDSAFTYNNLSDVIIPNSVISIGRESFSHNQISTLTLPNSLKKIGDYAFRSNNLTTVIIPESITSIPEGSFGYNALTSVKIHNGVTKIGDKAFRDNKLTSVIIPKGLTNVGWVAFDGNPNGGSEENVPVKLKCNGYIVNPTIGKDANVILDNSCKGGNYDSTTLKNLDISK